MSFNFVKWLEALINQKAAKMILPMRKAMFISFSFQEHWMKSGLTGFGLAFGGGPGPGEELGLVRSI